MPIDPVSAASPLLSADNIAIVALTGISMFLAWLLMAERKARQADKKDHDEQKAKLVALLKESQDARVTEIKDSSTQFHDGMRMMHSTVETLKTKMGV